MNIQSLIQRVYDSYKFADPRPIGALPSEAILKLFEAFALDCSDSEACLYTGVSKTDLLRHLASAEGGEFMRCVEILRNMPALISRRTLVGGLSDPEIAKWYLERKKSDEFNLRALLDVTSKGERLTMASLLESVKNKA